MTKECVKALLGDRVVLGASDKSNVSDLVVSESKLTDETSDSLTKTCKYSELAGFLFAS